MRRKTRFICGQVPYWQFSTYVLLFTVSNHLQQFLSFNKLLLDFTKLFINAKTWETRDTNSFRKWNRETLNVGNTRSSSSSYVAGWVKALWIMQHASRVLWLSKVSLVCSSTHILPLAIKFSPFAQGSAALSNIAEKDAFTLKVVNLPSGDNVTSLL